MNQPARRLPRPLPLFAAAALVALTPLCAAWATQAPPASTTAVVDADPAGTINRLVEARWKAAGVAPSAVCDDRTFCRRAYLDLAGRIPTPAEADAFAADTSSNKRAALVDSLLAGSEYARRMRDVFDVVFMGRKEGGPRRRRGQQEAGPGLREQWLAYLERSFGENRPWNRLVGDMLLARPAKDADRGAIWFLYDRQERYQEVAETVSPAVFGVQIQCAQCHDHPLADEIKQAHYWGLVAFFNRGKIKNTKSGPRVAESAIGGFNNFANLTGESAPALLSFLGAETVPETRPAEGQKEQDSPELYRTLENAAEDEPPVPKFSRREQFVQRVVQGNPLVARAAVNRFWALLMGRGIVHPVDKMDSKHPPSHPELLDHLAADFERSGFDVKRLVRAIVLSRPYQLDSRPGARAQPEHFAHGLEKPLTAEALYRSLMVAGTGRADAENGELREALVQVFPDVFPEENLSSLRQTMFLTNNALVQQLVRAGEGSAARLTAIADPAARVREAFRLAYTRDPDAEELKAGVAYLTARPDRPAEATAQLWWALLTGAEFRFNH